jgi:hypothetical protein
MLTKHLRIIMDIGSRGKKPDMEDDYE